MHITGMTAGPNAHPAFSKTIDLKFDERVNLFVGPNGSGKSSLLHLLARAGNVDKNSMIPLNPEVALSDDWPYREETTNPFSALPTGAKVKDSAGAPWVCIPATRVVLPSTTDDDPDVPVPGQRRGHKVVRGFDDFEVEEQEYLPYDTGNLDRIGMRLDKYALIPWQDSVQIFDGRWVDHFITILFDYCLKVQSDLAFLAYSRIVGTAYDCAKNIAAEIVTDVPGNFVFDSIGASLFNHPEDYEPLEQVPDLHPGMGVTTKIGPQGRQETKQFTGNLSSGTQSVYLWILYVGFKMLCFYDFDMQSYRRPAILLIDEIENHLHPTWQRRVIPALLEHFPGLQIFATTHSPFVVAGLRAGQVHLLNRDADGVITASTNTEDIVGWTADEILRTMMGVEDPTDEATAKDARELRRLRDAGPSDNAEEEERRQEKMQELRQKVDRDLLAGGPRAAEDERFAENLTNILERYRQSQDLNQENG